MTISHSGVASTGTTLALIATATMLLAGSSAGEVFWTGQIGGSHGDRVYGVAVENTSSSLDPRNPNFIVVRHRQPFTL